ncbi:MAG: carboxypeptidase regulatory-like domain-containing protein [Bacteroidota bacterium]
MKNQLRFLKVLGILFSVFLMSQAFAANGHLTGTVKTYPGPGTAIAGAVVTATSSTYSTVTATTDVSGNFDITCAPETYSNVAITFAAYHTIYVAGNYVVTSGGTNSAIGTQYMKPTHFLFTTGDGGAPLWEQFISLAKFDGTGLAADDEIAIYDGGVCVGLLVLSEAIPAPGPAINYYQAKYNLKSFSQLLNPSAVGYTAGNAPTFKCYSYATSTESVSCSAYHDPSAPETYSGSAFPSGWGSYGKTQLTFSSVPPVHLTGSVTSAGAVSGATVTWGSYTTTTNGSGNYDLSVQPGTNDLVVSKAHYLTHTDAGVVVAGATVKNVTLTATTPHFPTVAGNPSSTWSVYLSSASINATDLTTDDEIAVFDGATIVGSYVLDVPLTPGATTQHEMVAFEKQAPAPGYVPGHTYIFKCYSQSLGVELSLTAGAAGIGMAADGGNAFTGIVFPPTFSDDYSLVSLGFTITPGSINGTVTDNSVVPVALAGVLVEAKQGATVIGSAVTGPAGTYSITGLTAGTYSVKVTLSGYTFASSPHAGVVLAIGGSATVNFNDGVAVAGYQDIALVQGFQFVSTYLNPTNNNFAGAGSMIEAAHNGNGPWNNNALLESIKAQNGSMYQWNGAAFVDGIHTWDYHQAYVFNMNSATTFSVAGTNVPVTTPIDLTHDANGGVTFPAFLMVSYFPQGQMDASHALDGIKASLIWAKNSAGKTLRKIAGTWVNNIGNMKPGEGYQLYMSAPATLVYPTSKSGAEISGEDNLQHFVFGGGNAANAVYTIYVNGTGMNVGDEIAAYDAGVMVGAGKISSTTDTWQNSIPTFIQLGSGDGYHVGDPVTLRYWDSMRNLEYSLSLSPVQNSASTYYYFGTTYPGGDGRFTQFNVVKGPAGVNDNSAIATTIYPNPAHDYLKIVADRNIDRVSLLNIVGQVVAQKPVDGSSYQLSLSGINPGIYFLKIEANGQVSTQKVVIQ